MEGWMWYCIVQCFLPNSCLVAVQTEKCVLSENLVILNKIAKSYFN